MSAVAVAVAGLGKQFGSVTALVDLNLEVDAGEIVGLVGPDGAGKTTALRLIAGIMAPTAGSVSVLGADAASDAGTLHAATGYVPQTSRTYPDLTVRENLDFFADLHGVRRAARVERTARLMAWSRLEPARDRRARHLSGGMRQKLAVACAVVHGPRVLLLDEPTTGVDPGSRRDLWELLYELARDGVAIIVATPYLDEAERCHRVAFLHAGRTIALDDPRRLRAELPVAVMDVRLADAFTALPGVRTASGVVDAYLFGNAIHVLVAAEDADKMSTRLADRGIERAGVRRVPPRLEDVFVYRLGIEAASDAGRAG